MSNNETDPKYEVDDRGNVADFYENYSDGSWERIARLDREAGDFNGIDEVYDWDGGPDITKWAKENGYLEDITKAEKG